MRQAHITKQHFTADEGSMQFVDFRHIFRFVWPFLRSKTSSFLAPENDNVFVFNKFLGSFPLFSIFFLFSTHFCPPPRRFATCLPRSLASFLMRQLT